MDQETQTELTPKPNPTHEFRYALDNDDLELVKKYHQYNPISNFRILQYTVLQNLAQCFEFYLEKAKDELDFDQVRILVNSATSNSNQLYLESILNQFADHDLNQPTSNYKSVIGYLPLNTAIYEKKMMNVELLLEKGAKSTINYPKDGQTSLHLAIIVGHQGILQFLLEHQNESKLDVMNHRFNTPLHLAALKCDLALVKLLVEAGADLTLKNKQGYTPHDLVQLNQDSDPEDRKILIQYFKINKAQSTIGQSLLL